MPLQTEEDNLLADIEMSKYCQVPLHSLIWNWFFMCSLIRVLTLGMNLITDFSKLNHHLEIAQHFYKMVNKVLALFREALANKI